MLLERVHGGMARVQPIAEWIVNHHETEVVLGCEWDHHPFIAIVVARVWLWFAAGRLTISQLV